MQTVLSTDSINELTILSFAEQNASTNSGNLSPRETIFSVNPCPRDVEYIVQTLHFLKVSSRRNALLCQSVRLLQVGSFEKWSFAIRRECLIKMGSVLRHVASTNAMKALQKWRLVISNAIQSRSNPGMKPYSILGRLNCTNCKIVMKIEM